MCPDRRWSWRSIGNGCVPVSERNTDDGSTRVGQLPAVDSHFIEAEFAIPGQMRIDHRDRCVHGRARRRDQPFIRAVILDGIGLDSRVNQVCTRLAFRPAPDDIAAQRDHLPWFEFRRPGRHLVWMFRHELPDTGLKRLNDCSNLRTKLLVVFLGKAAMAPETLAVIMPEPALAEDFRHRALGFAIIPQHFFEPVLRLSVSRPISRSGRRRREDVRYTEFIAQDANLFGARGEGASEKDENESRHPNIRCTGILACALHLSKSHRMECPRHVDPRWPPGRLLKNAPNHSP